MAGMARMAPWPTLGSLAPVAIQPASGLQHQLAQPDRSGIELRPRRVKHELFVDAGIERWRDRNKRQLLRQCPDQALRHEGDEIGACRDMQRFDIAGHDQRDPPLDALATQPAVDQVFVLAADDDGDVPRMEENVAPLQLRANGVAAAYRERVTVGIEKLAMKSLERIADRDHEIDRARKLRGEDRRTAPGHNVEPDVRRQGSNLL